MNNSKRVTDGALLMAIYIVLLLMSVFLPLFILIGLFILPIPFIIYAAKYNWKPTLLIIILSLVLSLMFATIVSLPLTILLSLGGLAIGTALYNKENSHQVWAKGTLGFIIGMMLVFIFAQFFLGINWEQELNTMIDESFTMTEEIMVQTGTDNQVNEQLTLIKEQMQNLTLLIPASMTIMSIFLSIVTNFISYKIMNRINKEKYKLILLKDLNLPTSIFCLYFIANILSFFNPDTSTTLGVIVINSVVILTTLMIIKGYSFVFFYANEKKWPKAIPIIIVIVSFLIPLIMMLVIRLLGIIDIGCGLKKRIVTQAKLFITKLGVENMKEIKEKPIITNHLWIIYIVALLAIGILVYFNWLVGLLIGILVTLSFLYMYISERSYQLEQLEYISNLSHRVTGVGNDALLKMPIGIILYNDNYEIEWINPYMRGFTNKVNVYCK